MRIDVRLGERAEGHSRLMELKFESLDVRFELQRSIGAVDSHAILDFSIFVHFSSGHLQAFRCGVGFKY
jgi:hypothetical protein